MLVNLRTKLNYYRHVPPYDTCLLEKLEFDINEQIGLAMSWIPEEEMGALLSEYNYPCNRNEEIKNMKLSEEALHLCFNCE